MLISTLAVQSVLVAVLGVILYFILKNFTTTTSGAKTNITIPGSLNASTLNISGASKIGSLKIGSNGSTTLTEVRGVVPMNIEIEKINFGDAPSTLETAGFIRTVAVNFTGNVAFASIPNVICSLQLQAGATYWDQCSVAVSTVSTSQVVFGIREHTSAHSTSGVVNINYIAWV